MGAISADVAGRVLQTRQAEDANDPVHGKVLSGLTERGDRLAKGDIKVRSKIIAAGRVAGQLVKDAEFRKWVESNAGKKNNLVRDAFLLYKDDIHQSSLRDPLIEWTRDNSVADATVSDLTRALRESTEYFRGMEDHKIVASILSSQMIDAWARSSSKHRVSVHQQFAAQRVHGLDPSSISFLMKKNADQSALGLLDDSDKAVNDMIVRAEYKATQEWFRRMGITEIQLFRGVGAVVRDSPVYVGDSVQAEMSPLSSWTTYEYEAGNFGSSRTSAGVQRVVMSATVPVESIQSIPLTGRGCFDENEVVLIGSPLTAAIVESDGSYVWLD
jgi:hypothetical protein